MSVLSVQLTQMITVTSKLNYAWWLFLNMDYNAHTNVLHNIVFLS